ncbi:MAG: enoyl-CoA hydratase-related protein [Chloroflexi bacterium]|nr:enoyl-CoA hydratase-related protein [Chloroflexota bacterium]
MERQFVTLERDGHLATITINRPERMNALGQQVTNDLHSALDEVQHDRDVWVVILTGAGRGFCAGGDMRDAGARISAPDALPRTAGDDYVNRTMNVGRQTVELGIHVRELRQPVIGAVNGAAMGAGFSLALSCDVRVASDQARFQMAFTKRGFVPDTGATHLLPRTVGPALAAELVLTGRIIDADTALKMGVVNRVVPHDLLMQEARALADEMLVNPPITISMAKQALQRGLLTDLRTSVDYEIQMNATATRTADWQEGVKSFLEKRTAVFQGR